MLEQKTIWIVLLKMKLITHFDKILPIKLMNFIYLERIKISIFQIHMVFL